MKVLLGLVCFTTLLIFSLATDKCENEEVSIVLISYANEIDVHSCPHHKVDNATIIWYKSDNMTRISSQRESRIHQYEDKLWFVPAMVEDSGYYYCVVRNSTDCIKFKLNPTFMKNESNLCYNTQTAFDQKMPEAETGPIVCPYVSFVKDEHYNSHPMQWYKDCKPLLLGTGGFHGIVNKLIIQNATPAHSGIYTCRGSYKHLGQQYFFTRAIQFNTTAKIINELKIWSPANETMEVKLGSQLQLICNATGRKTDSVSWKWNGSRVLENELLNTISTSVKNPLTQIYTKIVEINIFKMEEKFYKYPFICTANRAPLRDTAYIQLVPPVPDYKKPMIGIFVILTVMVICSAIIYKIFKVDIILWYRDSCYNFLPKKASSDGKTYDAYILYPRTLEGESTSNLDIFVFKVLPEVLEKQCGYKLFIHGRDDNVGEDTIEVINENISKSRRLIIILAQGLLGFSWLCSSSEEQIAMYSALIKEGIKILLVELEKIQDYEKMPESIQFIQRKQGAICWSGDFEVEAQSVKTRFWKKVRYHMPSSNSQLQQSTSCCA